MAIRSFRHRGLRQLYEENSKRGVPAQFARKIADVLGALDAASGPEEMDRFPGWKLHPLKAEMKGFWGVTITGNWRVVFRFADGDAWDVDYTDYH
jgi:proteic killer suppression protein